MHGDDGYFDERVAARYDESSAEMFSPEAIDPTVDFLAGLASVWLAWVAVPIIVVAVLAQRSRKR